jgi:O-antigen/teichoic acid export membrane protein
MSSFKKFVLQFSHYFTGFGLIQLFGFITFPIMTRALTKEQYGIVGLIDTTLLLAVAVSKAGLSDGIIRFYKEYSTVPENRTLFSSTVLVRGMILSTFSVALYLGMLPVLKRALRIQDGYVICFIIMSVYLFLKPLNMIVTNFLRAAGKSVYLNTVNLIGKAMTVGLSLLFLLAIIGEFYGYFIGLVLAEIALSLILFFWFFSNFKVIPSKVSGDLSLKLIKFGLPLLFSEIAFLALSYVDRYLIVAYYDEAMLGLYSVGYNLAMYVANILMFSVSYAIVPIYVELYATEGREKTEAFLGKCMHYLIIVLIPVCFGYAAIAKDLFVALASEKYAAAALFSPIILVGSIFFALNSIYNSGLYLAKRTVTMLGIMLTAVAVKVLMNILLLPLYGVMGAALATLAPCILVTLLNAFLSRPHIRITVKISTVAYYLLLSGVMFLLVRTIEVSSPWLNLVLKIAAGVVIMAVGALYREEEVVRFLKDRVKAAPADVR